MTSLFGPDGKPIEDDSAPGTDVPVAIAALVKAEVNTAMDAIRHDHRYGIRKQAFIGALLVVCILVANVAFWIVHPDMVMDWTRQFVHERLGTPMLQAAADQIMTNQVIPYVETELVSVQADLELVGKGLDESSRKADHLIVSLAAATNQLARLLFSVQNRKKEVFRWADTNHVLLAEKEDGGFMMFLTLSTVPIPGSVDVDIPGIADRPGASARIYGNVYAVQYFPSALEAVKQADITVKYFPESDQSGRNTSPTTTTNHEVFVGPIHYDTYKRFILP